MSPFVHFWHGTSARSSLDKTFQMGQALSNRTEVSAFGKRQVLGHFCLGLFNSVSSSASFGCSSASFGFSSASFGSSSASFGGSQII
jgi:hypothetical protein